MASQQTRYEGVTLTDRYLTVHFRMEVGTAPRFVSVKIPVGDLAKVGVVPAIDKHVREELARLWAVAADDAQEKIPWEVSDRP